jgi:hypothetical protein
MSSIFWERLELKTDSGYPDTSFVLRNSTEVREGTVELKYQRTAAEVPNLHLLMKATQKANFIDYQAAGGRKRFLLSCNPKGIVSCYHTNGVVRALLNKTKHQVSPDLTMNLDPDSEWAIHKLLPIFLGE